MARPNNVVTDYTYDNNGNTTSKTDASGTTTYTWDYENRLTQVTLPDQSVVSFTYDPLGRRIRKSSASSTTIYAYDGADLIEEVDGSGVTVAQYLYDEGIDAPLAMLRGGASRFYQADGIGSISALTDTSGAIETSYTYDSYGNQTGSSGSLANPLRYAGREFDSETGFYFQRARYYDPSVGRFLSEDPIRFRGGENFFQYVSNRPLNYSDPLGLYKRKDHAEITYSLAKAVFGPRCDYVSREITRVNVDQDGLTLQDRIRTNILPSGEGWQRPGAHFPDDRVVRVRLDSAMKTCSVTALGMALHSLQDSIAHSGPYAEPQRHYNISVLSLAAKILSKGLTPSFDPDTTAAQDLVLADAVTSSTVGVLKAFRQKCYSCCR